MAAALGVHRIASKENSVCHNLFSSAANRESCPASCDQMGSRQDSRYSARCGESAARGENIDRTFERGAWRTHLEDCMHAEAGRRKNQRSGAGKILEGSRGMSCPHETIPV